MPAARDPLPRGVAGFSRRQIYDAVAAASAVSGHASTDSVARKMRQLYGREDISINSLAGTLRAMHDAGHLGMKKRTTAVNQSEHDWWWALNPPAA
jgi:hypothetical protein